ncbi:hypothetical protein A2690_00380 [Candidatus Roizmanbacteria bacterium RIFCSPHIGHO2_01_FULL_39_12b]|uniref:Uncharacterized protein n=1 Tax=Candidatus Roizmanbacteria bacterium RIFCSPHIGHO2_01_FULL_39_12b TaxID=1802030 RepID=A0A1F7G8L6_9BACT|nr:MAG: hypothetical protein A2690_00380 [Candidatus Roizmanbacteria bacterium RIFCSPHIGHO2_01_FULL_39_12b]OGK46023.1 MAG: hypothetical protein A3B46_00670 [Candidatus Roizmanbacteria bacterium RIFCSPLOWO2_01_FULL_39_19]
MKTFGCQQNAADSERIKTALRARGMRSSSSYKNADYVVINTCMVRESAENRLYGLVKNLEEQKKNKQNLKIVVTGCMVGAAFRDKTGKYLQRLKRVMPAVDEFMPIEEVGFDFTPLRSNIRTAWVPISNGCNNFCTFCIVPFTRGREISRPFKDIIKETQELKQSGYKEIVLLGQNVNSYGADLILGPDSIQVMRDLKPKFTYFKTPIKKTYKIAGRTIKPVFIKHLGRLRIPTLFPHLLAEIAKMGFEKIDFLSSNPWDFSDKLVDVIAKYPNITRTLHLALQSGDNSILKKMNRWYTSGEYKKLIQKIRGRVPGAQFTTDIIVGFCGETDKQFQNTVKICQDIGFVKAYIAMYSPRPFTASSSVMNDDVPHPIKKQRFEQLDKIINKPNLKRSAGIHKHY